MLMHEKTCVIPIFLSMCNVRNTFLNLIKHYIIVIRNDISIIMRASFNDIYANKTVIQTNSVKFIVWVFVV